MRCLRKATFSKNGKSAGTSILRALAGSSSLPEEDSRVWRQLPHRKAISSQYCLEVTSLSYYEAKASIIECSINRMCML